MSKLLFVLAIMGVVWWLVRPRSKSLPDVAEARSILGVGNHANADEVRAAHRRLVGAVHPDRGGSAELTRRVNAARDVLLRRLS